MPVTHFEENDHYFALPGDEPFSFAGLWESWQGDGETVLSCTILTTEPNAEVQAVGHHRMPVLLREPSDWRRWLDPDLDSVESFAKLFQSDSDGTLCSSPK